MLLLFLEYLYIINYEVDRMNKKGFTLIELMAVVIILVLIAVLAFPPITNQISSSKNKVSDVTKEMLYGAAENYINRHLQTYSSYTTRCVRIGDMVDDGILEAPIKDVGTGNEIDLNRKIKAELGVVNGVTYENDVTYTLLNSGEACDNN